MVTNQRKISRYILGTVFFLLTLVIIGIIVSNFQNSVQVRLDKYRVVANQLTFLLAEVREAESIQRGYLLSGNQNYNTPYQNAKKEAFILLQSIEQNEYIEELPFIRTDTIRDLLNSRFEEMETAILQYERYGIQAAIDIVKADDRRKIMNALRTEIPQQSEAIDAVIATWFNKSVRLNRTYTIIRLLALMGILYLLYVLYNIVKPILTNLNSLNQTLLQKEVNLTEKNRELEHFAFLTSHDLREPLRTIKNFVEIIEEELPENLDQTLTTYFQYVVNGVDRMENMINGMLTYSRLGQSRDKEEVDLAVLVQDILTDIQTRVREMKTDVQVSSLPVIVGYRQELRQLFQNLILNAIKFARKDERPHISIKVDETEDNWEFVISDNGIGIEERLRERIFNMFYKAHLQTEYVGQGLGLAFCKKIVELHGGQIWVESEVNKGSQFHFTISKHI
jgi:signal transduction histidine kinase